MHNVWAPASHPDSASRLSSVIQGESFSSFSSFLLLDLKRILDVLSAKQSDPRLTFRVGTQPAPYGEVGQQSAQHEHV